MRWGRCRIGAWTLRPRSSPPASVRRRSACNPGRPTEVWERLKAAHARVPQAGGRQAGYPRRWSRRSSFMLAGWATTWATARSPCTPPSSTTAGPGRTPTATPPSTRFTGSSRGRLWGPTSTKPRCSAKMTPVKAIDGDLFDAYVAYLRHTTDLCGKGLPTGESGRIYWRGNAGVAGVYRRAAGRRRQHVAGYDLHRLAGERQAGERSLRAKIITMVSRDLIP